MTLFVLSLFFISIATTLFLTGILKGDAFSPSSVTLSCRNHQHLGGYDKPTTAIYSAVEVLVEGPSESTPVEIVAVEEEVTENEKEDAAGPVSAELIISRLEKQRAKMRLKDEKSLELSKEVRLILVSAYFSLHHQFLQLTYLSFSFISLH